MSGVMQLQTRRRADSVARTAIGLIALVALSLLVASCAGPEEEPKVEPSQELARSPLTSATAQMGDSPLPTATRGATATLVPTFTPLPSATPMPTPAPGQLVVLHTNDNWGETEPCG